MFVRFSCGCQGLVVHAGLGVPIVLHPCDLQGDASHSPLTFHPRAELAEKSYEPLPEEEVERLVSELDRLVAEGYHLRQIRWLLKE